MRSACIRALCGPGGRAATALLVAIAALHAQQQPDAVRPIAPQPAAGAAAQAPAATRALHEQLRERLREQLDHIHANGSFAGATAAVVLPDGQAIVCATGRRDRAGAEPMQPEDRMLAGSVGKTLVAAVALQLVQEERLSLDDAVATHLGGEDWYARVPNAAALTVRMLMNHTSGVMRYEFDRTFVADLLAAPDRAWRPAECIAYVLDRAPRFAAGAGFEYSDTNYLLLGLVIERITGEPLFDSIQSRLLEPLQLRDTVAATGRSIPRLVQGHAGQRNPFGGSDRMLDEDGRLVLSPAFEWAGGGFASTAADLARWARHLYGGDDDRVLRPETLRQMLQGVAANGLGAGVEYGLGVIVQQTELGPCHGHSGFFPGYLTRIAWFGRHRIAIAVQVNTSEPRALGRPLDAIVLELAKAVVDGATEPPSHPRTQRRNH